MKRLLIILIVIVVVLPAASCTASKGNTVKVVKPKYHHRLYSSKSDKRVKRTKVARVVN